MRVRLAEPDDLEAMLEIVNWAILHTASNFSTSGHALQELERVWRRNRDSYPWLVAERDGTVLGFARGAEHRGRGAYAFTVDVAVYVNARHHGEGVGTALYERLIRVLAAQGFHTAVATIALPNEPSVKLHERHGFRHAGTLSQVGWKFGLWHDVGYWERRLNEPGGEPGPLRSVVEAWEQSQGNVFPAG